MTIMFATHNTVKNKQSDCFTMFYNNIMIG